MTVRVGIVDYQMGNLRSVQKGIERVGHNAVISSDRQELNTFSHLILPGVGAFGDAMSELVRRDLVRFLKDWAESGKPFLGICLGMQLLFESSDEGGQHEGLGILKGKVVRFENTAANASRKIPHMGWNQIASTRPNDPMLAGVSSKPYVYFVHSHYVLAENDSDVWLTTDYDQTVCAAVQRENVLATQFHPEKSQRDGLQLLSNWCDLYK